MKDYDQTVGIAWVNRAYREGRIGHADMEELLNFVLTYSMYEAMVRNEYDKLLIGNSGWPKQEDAHAAVLAGILEDLEAKKRRVV